MLWHVIMTLALFSGALDLHLLSAPFQVVEVSQGIPGEAVAYNCFHWTPAEGLPNSCVQALAQTREGYLWIGTREGLVCFNGIEFRIIPGLNVRSLVLDEQGVLWAGTMNCLLAWNGSELKTFRGVGDKDEAYRAFENLFQAEGGGVWARRDLQTYWRFRYADAPILRTAPDLTLTMCVGPAFLEAQGRFFWAELHAGLRSAPLALASSYTNSPLVHRDWLDGQILEAKDGAIWFTSRGYARGDEERKFAIYRLKDQRIVGFPSEQRLPEKFTALAEDARGRIWAGADGGLWVVSKNHLVKQEQFDFAGLRHISALLRDREGNLWIGTSQDGLFCLKERPITSLTRASGLISDDVWTISQAKDDTIWIGTSAGVSHVTREGITNINVSYNGRSPAVESIYAASDGAIWFGTGDHGAPAGIFLLNNGAITSYPFEDGTIPYSASVQAICEDSKHTLFVLLDHDWVWRWDISSKCFKAVGTTSKLVHTGAFCDQKDRFWIGGAKLHCLTGGKLRRLEDDPLTSIHAVVHESSDGALWLASASEGIIRYKNGRFKAITTEHGLSSNLGLSLQEDASGRFWVNTHQGIYSVAKSDLDSVADGRSESVTCASYATNDGMPALEGNGGTFPNSCKASDGKIWFPTVGGVAVLDPPITESDLLRPQVTIESVQANGRTVYDRFSEVAGQFAGKKSQLPTSLKELRFDPSKADTLVVHVRSNVLLQSDKVRYRYRLADGSQWVDRGTEPTVLLNELPAGHHRLQIIASNSHGVWSKEATTLAFYIAPFFYKTWTFYFAVAIAGTLALGGLVEYRSRMHRRIASLEKEAAIAHERERIARDLHDDLGASLSRIALLSEVARTQTSPELADSHLARVAEMSRTVVDGIGELVWSANPKYDNVGSMLGYFREYAANLFGPLGITFHFDPSGAEMDQQISARIRRDLFLILKEALTNVAKHACATEVRINIRCDAKLIALSIVDNGRGLRLARASEFRHGLENMRTRVEKLGGDFSLQSDRLNGTSVICKIPIINMAGRGAERQKRGSC